MSKFTPQELFAIATYLDQRKRQKHKFSAQTAALTIIADRYPKMNIDSQRLTRLTAEYRILEKNSTIPKPKFTVASNCYVLLRGVQIKDLSLLHGGKYPENQPWLDLERKCLLCNIRQNGAEHGFSKTTLTKLFQDLSPYFGRSTSALWAEWNNLKSKRK